MACSRQQTARTVGHENPPEARGKTNQTERNLGRGEKEEDGKARAKQN